MTRPFGHPEASVFEDFEPLAEEIFSTTPIGELVVKRALHDYLVDLGCQSTIIEGEQNA